MTTLPKSITDQLVIALQLDRDALRKAADFILIGNPSHADHVFAHSLRTIAASDDRILALVESEQRKAFSTRFLEANAERDRRSTRNGG